MSSFFQERNLFRNNFITQEAKEDEEEVSFYHYIFGREKIG